MNSKNIRYQQINDKRNQQLSSQEIMDQQTVWKKEVRKLTGKNNESRNELKKTR